MNDETEKIYATLAEVQRELANLRQGYLIVNQRYTETLASLNALTAHTTEAARQAAIAAEKAALAAKNVASVAMEAASKAIIAVAQSAAKEAAADAAADAAAAAAAKRGTDAAAEGFRIVNAATESARKTRG